MGFIFSSMYRGQDKTASQNRGGGMMRHKVKISVGKTPILESKAMRIPGRLMKFLLGDAAEVILLKPGNSVEQVEIHEVPERRT
jgi:hypothetical protein